MTRFTATVASADRHSLAEGPVWDAAAGRLLWIDVTRGQVFEGLLDASRIEQTARHDFDGMVGAVAVSAAGDLLVAEQEHLTVLSGGLRTPGPVIVPSGALRRCNDGAVDPAGRFLIGTLAFDDAEGGETLLRVEDDASLTVIDDDLTLSNGLAWSPDGSLLYSIDTVPGTIWVRDYDAATGAAGPRREFLHIEGGYPDGMCVDERGYLWVAIWNGFEVRSFAPDGTASDTVSLPCPHVSSVAFAGPRLDTLVITTSSRDLDEAGIERYPDAGRLFVADVGVAGTPCAAWSGSWAGRADRGM